MPTGSIKLGCKKFFSGNWYVYLAPYLGLLIFAKSFILSYVGVASSIGQPVDIPIILRSLADSLALVDVSLLPLSFDPEMLDTLDIGIDDDKQCRTVPSYHCAWWLVGKPRNLDSADVMDQLSIDRCLENFRNQLLPFHKGEVIDSSLKSTRPTLLPVLMAPVAPGLASSKGSCGQCLRYRDLLGNVLH